VSENAPGKRINELIKSKNQSLQPFENRIKPNQHQLIMKNTKQPNLSRKKGLFRGARHNMRVVKICYVSDHQLAEVDNGTAVMVCGIVISAAASFSGGLFF